MAPEIASVRVRSRILYGLVKDEVTGGARVEHRDSVSAILARGSERFVVTVDWGGAVHVDRLVGPLPRRRSFLAITALGIAAVVLIVVLLDRLGILPG